MLRSLCLVLGLLLAPVLSAAEATPSKIILTVVGPSKASHELSMLDLDKLPQKKLTVATPWYAEPQTFEGPLLRDVLKLAGVKGKTMKFQALNDYTIEVPASDVEKYDVVLASRLNGKMMAVREKGPLFVMYPFDTHEELRKTDYFSRCAWQLKQITLD